MISLATLKRFRPNPLALAAALLWCGAALAAPPIVELPKTSLQPDELAVVVNAADPLSRRIGEYYRMRRNIPADNMIEVRFPPDATDLSARETQRVVAEVYARTPAAVQAYALTWMRPYRAGCMSVTTAFATAYDTRYCPARACAPTGHNPYFDSNSTTPYRDFRLRPTMALAAQTFDEAKALIDRGIASDRSYPRGTAYLLRTSDLTRSVRAGTFPLVKGIMGDRLNTEIVLADYIEHKRDILFYFTGSSHVRQLRSNHFIPGAIADHLTSTGGILDGTSQMSSMAWLRAGATASYGTVQEPCNFTQKFPAPEVVIPRYFNGESLIEAYWKGVQWPAEGIFIGEPLANPFGGIRSEVRDGTLTLRTQALRPGVYALFGSDSVVGPYRREQQFTVDRLGMMEHVLHGLASPYYRLIRAR